MWYNFYRADMTSSESGLDTAAIKNMELYSWTVLAVELYMMHEQCWKKLLNIPYKNKKTEL